MMSHGMMSNGMGSDTDIADIHDHFATKYPEKFANAVHNGFTSDAMSSSTEESSSHEHSHSHSHGHGHGHSHSHGHILDTSDKDKGSDTELADIHDHFAAKYPEKFENAQEDMNSEGMTSEEMNHEASQEELDAYF